MKTREIIIEPIIELRCEIQGQLYWRKVFEGEIIGMEIGDTISVITPYMLKDIDRDIDQIASLVGYDEEHYFVMVDLYDNEKRLSQELVVLSYES